jgi:hypothetical protein
MSDIARRDHEARKDDGEITTRQQTSKNASINDSQIHRLKSNDNALIDPIIVQTLRWIMNQSPFAPSFSSI